MNLLCRGKMESRVLRGTKESQEIRFAAYLVTHLSALSGTEGCSRSQWYPGHPGGEGDQRSEGRSRVSWREGKER